MERTSFQKYLDSGARLLTEGSIFERLRRDPRVRFDPDLAHAALFDEVGAREALEHVHRDYIDAAVDADLGMVCFTDTWRANVERISRSKYNTRPINQECANFLCKIRDSYSRSKPIFVGGLIGCRGDAYKPGESLPEEDAFRFHLPQIQALSESRIDFLFASTLPAVAEAQGIARAMATTDLPYLLSFVIRSDGTVLDGTLLNEAIDSIDRMTERPPLAYFVNCVHPTVFCSALAAAPSNRIWGLQGNTSRRSPEEIDGSAELDSQDPDEYALDMLQAIRQCRLKIAGGCCGTDTRHMIALGSRMRER